MQVFSTTDYGKFKLIDANRRVDQKQVNKLINSMSVKYVPYPIDVNSSMEIIDGQHRLEACKALSLPIYYIIHEEYDFEDVYILNQNRKNWTALDFIRSYARKGNQSYIRLNNFINKYDLTVTNAFILISQSGQNPSKQAKSGRIEVTEEQIQKASDMYEYILKFKEYIDFYKTRHFVFAVRHLFRNEDFDRELLLHKIASYRNLAHNTTCTSDMIKMLERIYNYHNHKKIIFS